MVSVPRPTADHEAIADHTLSLQNGATGAFAWTPTAGPDLGATSIAVRILKDCGRPLPRRDALIDFVLAHFDARTHGFAPRPGEMIQLPSTAMGHVTLAILGISQPRYTDGLTDLVDSLVRASSDVWIAAPFLDTVGLRAPAAERWAQLVVNERSPDGTWGETASRAAVTASQASALALLGFPISNPEPVGQALLDSQLPDGGWPGGEQDGHPTLKATYEVTRGLRALGIAPDRAAITTFIHSCRRPNGLYGNLPATDGTGDLVNNYRALTIDRWVNSLNAEGIN